MHSGVRQFNVAADKYEDVFNEIKNQLNKLLCNVVLDSMLNY